MHAPLALADERFGSDSRDDLAAYVLSFRRLFPNRNLDISPRGMPHGRTAEGRGSAHLVMLNLGTSGSGPAIEWSSPGFAGSHEEAHTFTVGTMWSEIAHAIKLAILQQRTTTRQLTIPNRGTWEAEFQPTSDITSGVVLCIFVGPAHTHDRRHFAHSEALTSQRFRRPSH